MKKKDYIKISYYTIILVILLFSAVIIASISSVRIFNTGDKINNYVERLVEYEDNSKLESIGIIVRDFIRQRVENIYLMQLSDLEIEKAIQRIGKSGHTFVYNIETKQMTYYNSNIGISESSIDNINETTIRIENLLNSLNENNEADIYYNYVTNNNQIQKKYIYIKKQNKLIYGAIAFMDDFYKPIEIPFETHGGYTTQIKNEIISALAQLRVLFISSIGFIIIALLFYSNLLKNQR